MSHEDRSWTEQKEDVLSAIGNRRLTYNEIVAETGIPINYVTWRIHELKREGRVEDVGYKLDPHTGKMNTAWAATPYDGPRQTTLGGLWF